MGLPKWLIPINKETIIMLTIRIHRMKSEKGITLIELLVVIVIVGILAAIAIPVYTSYLQRARRADAKTALEQVRAVQEMWRAEKGCYANTGGAAAARLQLQTTMGAPPTTVGYYNWSFTGILSANTFTAQSVPFGSQTTDGTLTINQNDVKLPADKWAK
jgi:type IV pilus assembly protein PilE